MAATSDFTGYSNRFGGYSGTSGRELVSQVVSRRHRRCDLRIDPIAKMALLARHHARSAAEEEVVTRRLTPAWPCAGLRLLTAP
jgi:hypothetical protein